MNAKLLRKGNSVKSELSFSLEKIFLKIFKKALTNEKVYGIIKMSVGN